MYLLIYMYMYTQLYSVYMYAQIRSIVVQCYYTSALIASLVLPQVLEGSWVSGLRAGCSVDTDLSV